MGPVAVACHTLNVAQPALATIVVTNTGSRLASGGTLSFRRAREQLLPRVFLLTCFSSLNVTLCADPSRSTGAYKARTGSLRMKGQHETSNFPAEATFDDFYWIQLDAM